MTQRWSGRMVVESDPGGRMQTRQVSTFSDPRCPQPEDLARAETQRGGFLPPYKKEPQFEGEYRCLTTRLPRV